MKAIVTVGVSASGKTTFAKELVAQGWLDVNRDDIRFDIFCGGNRDWSLYKFSKDKENRVTQVQESMVDGAQMLGQNVIISDTNINDKTRNFWIDRLTGLGYDVEVKYFDIDLLEALKRDARRCNGVGYEVITDQYARYMKLRHGQDYHKHVVNRKHCILCDIDGSLAEMHNRKPFEWSKVGQDLPRSHVVEMVNSYYFDDNYESEKAREVIFVSGRDAVCQKETRQWLIDNVGGWTDSCWLLMREQGDFRKDTVVKKEIFDKYIRNNYNVDYVIDDRKTVLRMWAYELGLTTVDVGVPHNEF